MIFNDVDVLTYIEIELDGGKFPLAYIVRAANRKTWREIHDEIRSVTANPEQSPNAQRRRAFVWFMILPRFVLDVFYRALNLNPRAWKKFVGTVYLTAVGMFGKGGGWGIGFSAHTPGITLGGISEKPVVVDGRIEIRECLDLTADCDHDVVDGGGNPGLSSTSSRFIRLLATTTENGFRPLTGRING